MYDGGKDRGVGIEPDWLAQQLDAALDRGALASTEALRGARQLTKAGVSERSGLSLPVAVPLVPFLSAKLESR